MINIFFLLLFFLLSWSYHLLPLLCVCVCRHQSSSLVQGPAHSSSSSIVMMMMCGLQGRAGQSRAGLGFSLIVPKTDIVETIDVTTTTYSVDDEMKKRRSSWCSVRTVRVPVGGRTTDERSWAWALTCIDTDMDFYSTRSIILECFSSRLISHQIRADQIRSCTV